MVVALGLLAAAAAAWYVSEVAAEAMTGDVAFTRPQPSALMTLDSIDTREPTGGKPAPAAADHRDRAVLLLHVVGARQRAACRTQSRRRWSSARHLHVKVRRPGTPASHREHL